MQCLKQTQKLKNIRTTQQKSVNFRTFAFHQGSVWRVNGKTTVIIIVHTIRNHSYLTAQPIKMLWSYPKTLITTQEMRLNIKENNLCTTVRGNWQAVSSVASAKHRNDTYLTQKSIRKKWMNERNVVQMIAAGISLQFVQQHRAKKVKLGWKWKSKRIGNWEEERSSIAETTKCKQTGKRVNRIHLIHPHWVRYTKLELRTVQKSHHYCHVADNRCIGKQTYHQHTLRLVPKQHLRIHQDCPEYLEVSSGYSTIPLYTTPLLSPIMTGRPYTDLIKSECELLSVDICFWFYYFLPALSS